MIKRLYRDPSWTEQAACTKPGVNVEWFFPERGSDAHPTTTAAKFICRGCPSRERCLEHALDNNITTGIFGGLSPHERRPLRHNREAA